MKLNNLSAKKICRLISTGMVFSMLVITGIFGGIMQDTRIFIAGGTLTLCAFFWIWLLVLFFGKRLSHFTSNLCRTLDNMIDGNEELQKSNDSETLFARINHRLIRLYEIMQKNRHKVDMERQELQMLISDISHQVKTPVSNLQMVTDTLLTKPVSEEERMDFLQGIRSQTDKLDFLFQALVKTSRLETGAIRLEKKDSSLFHTLAQAMSSIVYAAEKKEIAVSVDCPENLIISHDSKWTSEALFNLLDNAVKYTPSGGKISVSVVQWEMYVEVKVTDTGKGKVYMYYFDQDSENTIVKSRKGGASHVAEMPFIYGYKFGSGKMTETEQHMEQIMSRYWINFTKTGNPNGDSLPFWTSYQEGKPTVMIMKEGLHLGPVQNQKQMDFFEKFFKEKRK